MQDQVWIVDRLVSDQWVPHRVFKTRKEAREFKHQFRMYIFARIRKFVAV